MLSWPIWSFFLVHKFISTQCERWLHVSILSVAWMHIISRDFVAWTNLLRYHVFAGRDVGDKYLAFQSLDARNLLSTDVRYNFPVDTGKTLPTASQAALARGLRSMATPRTWVESVPEYRAVVPRMQETPFPGQRDSGKAIRSKFFDDIESMTKRSLTIWSLKDPKDCTFQQTTWVLDLAWRNPREAVRRLEIFFTAKA